jgi:anti-anti-sigma regulatory factor
MGALEEDACLLRISSANEARSPVVLTVEGDLVGDWVPLLQTECLRRLDARKPVELNFAGVGFIDRVGVAMVHGLFARGVRVVGASALVKALLDHDSQHINRR